MRRRLRRRRPRRTSREQRESRVMKMKGDAKSLAHGHSFGVPNTSLFSVEPRWYPPVPIE